MPYTSGKNITKFLLILLLGSAELCGQSKIDSVLTSFRGQPDTTQIKSLSDLCWKYRSNDYKFGLDCGETALIMARKISNKKLEAKALNLVGIIYRGLGNYDKSLTLSMNALSVAEQCKDSIEMAYAENNIGGTYRLKFYNRLALEHILKGLKIFEEQKYRLGVAFCQINVGFVYLRMFNYQKALEYFELCYVTRKEMNDKGGVAIALGSMASAYLEMHNLEAARQKFLEAEQEYQAAGDKSGLIASWIGLGGIYLQQKNYQKSLSYYKRALTASEKLGTPGAIISCRKNIGLAYAQIGRFDLAELYLDSALKQAYKFQDGYTTLTCYNAYSKLYELKKDYPNSIKFLKMYNSLKDSVITQENIKGVGEMEAVYKNEKAIKENAILQKNFEIANTQRDYWVVIALLLIISLSVIYARFHFKIAANRKLNELNAMKDKFFGIIAHDLKNPFHAIFGVTSILLEDFEILSDEDKLRLIKELDKTGRQTHKLLENLLYWSLSQSGSMVFDPGVIDLTEISAEAITLHMSAAQNKNISLKLLQNKSIKAFGDEEMVKTVIRNLISNGIKFTMPGGEVMLDLSCANGIAEVTVADNGIGITEALKEKLFKIDNMSKSKGTAGEKGTGLGLILCKDFIERNGGTFHLESSVGKGSEFSFTLPSIN